MTIFQKNEREGQNNSLSLGVCLGYPYIGVKKPQKRENPQKKKREKRVKKGEKTQKYHKNVEIYVKKREKTCENT